MMVERQRLCPGLACLPPGRVLAFLAAVCVAALVANGGAILRAEEAGGSARRPSPVLNEASSSPLATGEDAGREGAARRDRGFDENLLLAAEAGEERGEAVEQEAAAPEGTVPAEPALDEQLINAIREKLGLTAPQAAGQPQMVGVQRWIPDFRIEVNMIGNKTYYEDKETAKAILREEDGEDEDDGEGLPVDKFELNEVEFGFQTAIDPYARADVFLSAAEGEAELEEGYLTLVALPYGIQARIGKFRTPYGEINDIDPEEMPFVDYPPALMNIFGPEGAVETGAWANIAFPGPRDTYLLYWLGITDGANDVSFHGGDANKPNLFSRFEVFKQVGQYAGWEVGTAFITGYNDPDGLYRTHIENVHFEFDWKDPYLSMYKSFAFQAEIFFVQREMPWLILDGEALEEVGEEETAELIDIDLSGGLYHIQDDEAVIIAPPGGGGHMETSLSTYGLARYQLSRRWFVSGRADYSQLPVNSDWHESAYSGTLMFNPSRFLNFRAQYKHTDRNFGIGDTDELYFQVLFKIGFERPEVF